jgi:hypothetical protein
MPCEWQKRHRLKLLEINGKSQALLGLFDLRRRSERDFKKLMATVKLQLESENLLSNEKRVRKGRKADQREIIEFKASGGHARLFAFFAEKNELIICTNTYWKTSSDKTLQNRAFAKAASMRETYMKNAGTKKGNQNER